jgi:hypothetical protein
MAHEFIVAHEPEDSMLPKKRIINFFFRGPTDHQLILSHLYLSKKNR